MCYFKRKLDVDQTAPGTKEWIILGLQQGENDGLFSGMDKEYKSQGYGNRQTAFSSVKTKQKLPHLNNIMKIYMLQ